MNGEDEIKAQAASGPLKLLQEELGVEAVTAKDPEFRKLFLALGRVASHLESEFGTVGRILARLDRHERILMGENDKVGLKGSVDKLIEEMQRRRKIQYAVLSSVVGLLMLKLGEMLLKHFPP